MTANNPLQQTLDFIGYIDQLKNVIRRNALWDGSRPENTAEHSWHAALSAQLLAPYANQPIDVDRVTRMLLIHDLIEIEAGDTFVYDAEGMENQEAAELKAAQIVFGSLPEEQGKPLRLFGTNSRNGPPRMQNSPRRLTVSCPFTAITAMAAIPGSPMTSPKNRSSISASSSRMAQAYYGKWLRRCWQKALKKGWLKP